MTPTVENTRSSRASVDPPGDAWERVMWISDDVQSRFTHPRFPFPERELVSSLGYRWRDVHRGLLQRGIRGGTHPRIRSQLHLILSGWECRNWNVRHLWIPRKGNTG